MTIVICEECNDAPAVTRRKFAGATVTDLCEGCAAYWDAERLVNRDGDSDSTDVAS